MSFRDDKRVSWMSDQTEHGSVHMSKECNIDA